MFYKRINEVTQRFYICTLLPIIAFDDEGNVIGCAGYDSRFNRMFAENDIYERIIDAFSKSESNEPLTISNEYDINYTACFIDPKNMYRGIFILGPHKCNGSTTLDIPYKPRCLMKNLISLLYSIGKDINYRKCHRNHYSYHVKKALDYMEAKSNSNITLQDVADYINLNKSYLCTLLKKETGKTFTSILNEMRVEKSKSLLQGENNSILDIALASGFNNQNYFNIIFKKITGMTPLEYKNNSISV